MDPFIKPGVLSHFFSQQKNVILSGVWRVLCAKRSRRTCFWTAKFLNELPTRDTRSKPNKSGLSKRNSHFWKMPSFNCDRLDHELSGVRESKKTRRRVDTGISRETSKHQQSKGRTSFRFSVWAGSYAQWPPTFYNAARDPTPPSSAAEHET